MSGRELEGPGADSKGCRLWVGVSAAERGPAGEELRNRVLLGLTILIKVTQCFQAWAP